jgi:putative ABC transport system permease protein
LNSCLVDSYIATKKLFDFGHRTKDFGLPDIGQKDFGLTVFKNHLKIAVRNLRKHKEYSLINIIGLAAGLACCILILLYVLDELNFDAFHKKADRIYRVVEIKQSPDLGEQHSALTAGTVGPALVSELPEIANSVRLLNPFTRRTVQHGETRFYEADHLFTEPSFFELFDFALAQGDPKTALRDPKSVVLTAEAARKYFGDEEPYGKTLMVEQLGDFKVTGVLRAMPRNSHLNFSMLFSFATLEAIDGWKRFMNTWDSDGFITYVLLKEDHAAVPPAKLAAFVNQHKAKEFGVTRSLYLQPLRQIHFYSSHIQIRRNENKGEIAYVYIFSAIAIFIVLIACINYMNLATARSMHFAKDVGIRKAVGAHRGQLIGQFLSESILFAFVAFLIAYATVELILPAFNAFTGKKLQLGFSASSLLLLGLGLMTLLVGVVSGSYPSFYLSRFQPAFVLKGSFKTGAGNILLRRGLVVAQFVLSIVMIVATLVVSRQMRYVREKRLGFEKEQMLVIDINSGNARRNFQTMKAEFAQIPAVRGVSVSSRVPGEWKNIVEIEALPEGAPESEIRTMSFIGIDEDFLATFGVDLMAGRNFLPEVATDSAAILLNEAAAQMFGGEAVVGKRLQIPLSQSPGDAPAPPFQGLIIGIVKDFHFRSLYEKIDPLVLGHCNNPFQLIDYFTLKIDGRDIPATLAAAQRINERFDPSHPFEYNFLDARLKDFYVADQKVGRLFGIAAALAILIACLGLFGLASYTAEQRTKEIGVRKVLGASAPHIVLLLSKDIAKLMLIAFIIASPLAYYAMNKWLQDFAYKIDVGWSTFGLAGILTLAIALLTVSYQAIKAALANPVDSLRYE